MRQRLTVPARWQGGMILVLGAAYLLALSGGAAAQEPEDNLQRAEAVLERVPLIDGHNDVPWQYRRRHENRLDAIDLASDTSALEPTMHTDLERLRQGRVGAQFWSAYVRPQWTQGPDAVQGMIEQIDLIHRMTRRYDDTFAMAYTADDIERIFEQGKIASLIGVEGGNMLNNSLAVLRMAYEMGARYMTVTHNLTLDWADAATDDPEHDGLSDFGREVIAEMNHLGMMVDLSHVSPQTMRDALAASEAPVIFSHSSVRALNDHPRNVPDDVLEALADHDGVLMVTFVEHFISEPLRQHLAEAAAEQARLEYLYPGQPDEIEQRMQQWRDQNPTPRATVADVADHIDHARAVMGIEHIGIGGDYDGVTRLPEGLEDVSTYPALFAELLDRGYSEQDLEKIAGENVLRVMRAVEQTAEQLQAEREPSDAQFEDFEP